MNRPIESSDFDSIQKSLSLDIKECLVELQCIWEDLGLTNESKWGRLEKFKEHVKDVLQCMRDEEEGHKLQIVRMIKSHLRETSHICQELGIQMPQRPDRKEPLYQVEKALRDDLRELQKIKDDRLQKYTELKRQEDELNTALGLKSRSPLINAIPTEEQIRELERYVQDKTEEKLRLDALFRESRQAICKLMQDLGAQPRLDFEKVVVDCPEQFRPTQQHMAKLKDLHSSLEQQAERARQQSTELREKLSYLWERLQISGEDRVHFLDNYPGYTFSTIEALKKELKRCEALKSANIAVFVKQLRAELEDWWDKCFYSTEQRQKFAAYFSEDFTEDLLDIHEVEVNNLRHFYEENRDIFQLTVKRQKLWEKMKELEAVANDPSRLFKNRGGTLLKEEKERKAIQKELPRIEAELVDLLTAYQETHDEPFLVNGNNLLKVIHEQWDQRLEKKEKEKIQRKINRDQIDGRSPGRTLRTTPTPNKLQSMRNTPLVPKSAPAKSLLSVPDSRKRPLTPLDHVSKRSKTASKTSERTVSRRSVPRIRRFGKGSPHYQVALNSTRAAKESRHSPKSRRNLMPQIGSTGLEDSVATSYSEFQEQLEMLSAEKTCRSSVVPERFLRERNLLRNSPDNGHSRLLPSKNRPDTPGRGSRATALKVSRLGNATSSAVTPRKTPSAIPTTTTPGRTRSAVRSPAVGRSPLSVTKTRLTTARGRLPIII